MAVKLKGRKQKLISPAHLLHCCVQHSQSVWTDSREPFVSGRQRSIYRSEPHRNSTQKNPGVESPWTSRKCHSSIVISPSSHRPFVHRSWITSDKLEYSIARHRISKDFRAADERNYERALCEYDSLILYPPLWEPFPSPRSAAVTLLNPAKRYLSSSPHILHILNPSTDSPPHQILQNPPAPPHAAPPPPSQDLTMSSSAAASESTAPAASSSVAPSTSQSPSSSAQPCK